MSKSRISVISRSLFVPVVLLSLGACSAIEGRETAGEYLDDSTLTTKVKEAFIADSQIKSLQINVETMEGVVQLSGFVDSSTTESRAVHDAEQVHGVKMVKDSLVIAPKSGS